MNDGGAIPIKEIIKRRFRIIQENQEDQRIMNGQSGGIGTGGRGITREMPKAKVAKLVESLAEGEEGEIDQPSLDADDGLSPYLYSTVSDKTTDRKTHGTQFTFTGYEINIARYAVTALVKESIMLGCPVSSLVDSPSTIGIETNVKERTIVYDNVLATFEQGILCGIYFGQSNIYRVEIVSETKSGLNNLVRKFGYELERSNFYQGRCLKIGERGINFIDVPVIKLDDVVLPEKVRVGFLDNTVHFLTCPKMHKITKKRGIILYGPPGTGKTSLVSATFNKLNEEKVTCLYVAGDSFRRVGFDETFRFVLKYLAPCMVVLEDFDLLAFDRNMGNKGIIGDILSWLNGIEDMKKPLCIVGTTNRFDVLDVAATRPCRFDRHYKIDFPSEKEVVELWEKMVGTNVNGIKKYVGKVTGAHIREIANTTKMMVARTGNSIEDCAEKALEEVVDSFLMVMPKGVGFQPERSNGEEPGDLKVQGGQESLGDMIHKRTGL